MLPLLYRLPTKQFEVTLRSGIRMRTDMLQCIYVNTQEPHSRLGVIIGKSFEKTAIGRNRIKRQITMAFFPYLIQDKQSKDIVCKITKTNIPNSFKTITRAVDTFFTNTV